MLAPTLPVDAPAELRRVNRWYSIWNLINYLYYAGLLVACTGFGRRFADLLNELMIRQATNRLDPALVDSIRETDPGRILAVGLAVYSVVAIIALITLNRSKPSPAAYLGHVINVAVGILGCFLIPLGVPVLIGLLNPSAKNYYQMGVLPPPKSEHA